MASLIFKDSAVVDVASPTIKSIIYEDAAQNKYTFGVDNATNVFNTFKYEPNGATEIDYSATATKFMTGGAIATLLGIGANVDAIKTKTEFIPDTFTADVATIKDATSAANLGNKVTAIQTKTDKMPDDLGTELGKLAKSAELAPLAKTADVTAIRAKTDKMPDDLQEELDALPGFRYIDTLVVPLAKTADVAAIKAKIDKMPDDLGTELGKLAKSAELAPLVKTAELDPLAKTAELAPLAKTADVAAIKAKTDKITDTLGTDVTAIRAKTDKMPADLNAELIKLTTIAETLNGSPQAAAAAKAVLESSFKQAITDAGQEGSEWLRNEIKEIKGIRSEVCLKRQ